MKAILMPDGTMLIPVRAESGDGHIGDAMKLITPDDPEYQDWLPFAEEDKPLFNSKKD